MVQRDRPGRISRLIRRDTICGSPEDLAEAQKQLDAEMTSGWDAKWGRGPDLASGHQ